MDNVSDPGPLLDADLLSLSPKILRFRGMLSAKETGPFFRCCFDLLL